MTLAVQQSSHLRDDVRRFLGAWEVEGNTAKLLDKLADVGTLSADKLGVELLVNDHVDGLQEQNQKDH